MFIESLTGVANGYVQVDSAAQSPHEKESTDAQDVLGYYSGSGSLDQFQYQGRSTAPWGTLGTYRWMDCHPTLSLAKAVTVGPGIGAPYSVEADEGTPDNWVTCIERAFLKNMMGIASDAFDALSLRWSPFEIYYEPDDEGEFIIPKFKPLLQEMTAVLVTKEAPHTIVGLKNSDVELRGPNWYVFAEHPKNGKLWGKSRHENSRQDAWWPWMEANKQGGRLDKKATGIVFLVKGPQGGKMIDENKNIITPQQASKNLANLLAQGITAYCPNQVFTNRELKITPELAKTSAFVVEYFDLGDTAPANLAITTKQRYYDSLMFRGWKRPERSATEGQRGTLAEAEVHGDIGTDDSDLLRSLFAHSLNVGPVNHCLEQNFGPKARNKVYLKPAPIVPARFQVLKMIMEKACSSPQLLARILEETDADAVYDVLGIPKKNDLVNLKTKDLGEVQLPAPADPKKNGELNGNPKTTPANGNRVPA